MVHAFFHAKRIDNKKARLFEEPSLQVEEGI